MLALSPFNLVRRSWIGEVCFPAMVVQLDASECAQPSIEADENADESAKVDEEDELSTDQIRASRKVNTSATIEALCLKPSSLSRLPIPMYRMVAIRIVRPTLSSDLVLLEDDFVHGY
jgi:hypothetical protein